MIKKILTFFRSTPRITFVGSGKVYSLADDIDIVEQKNLLIGLQSDSAFDLYQSFLLKELQDRQEQYFTNPKKELSGEIKALTDQYYFIENRIKYIEGVEKYKEAKRKYLAQEEVLNKATDMSQKAMEVLRRY